jgi:hypothetical protein
MNPEIRAILFGLLIAALACPAILALFFTVFRAATADWMRRLDTFVLLTLKFILSVTDRTL